MDGKTIIPSIEYMSNERYEFVKGKLCKLK